MPKQPFLFLIFLTLPFWVSGQFSGSLLIPEKSLLKENGKNLSFKVWLRHPTINKNNPVAYSIIQTRDKKGIPSGYRLQVNSVVCLDNVCEIIKLTMVWDGTGAYNHIELPKGKNLTKGPSTEDERMSSDTSGLAEHVDFSEYDYTRLDSILSDKYSLLKYHQLEEMTADSVDAKSGATSETIKRSVIPGAAYTCYNLWHWANGDVSAVCDSLTELSCGRPMLVEFLKSDSPNHISFALRHLTTHRIFDKEIVAVIQKSLQGGDYHHTEGVLLYLKKASTQPDDFTNYISDIFFNATSQTRVNILMLLGKESDLPLPLLDSLSRKLPDFETYRETHLLLSLIEKYNYTSKVIQNHVLKALQNQDTFISRRAYAYLRKQNVDADVMKLMTDYLGKMNER